MIKEHYPLIDSLLAKLRGKEPYVGWFELLMMHMQRKLILLTTHMQRKLMLLKQEEREKNEESGWQKITEGAFIKYSNENYTFYWPSSFAASDPVSQFHCIEKGNPHSYFDFYDPADGDVIFDIGACEGFFALELFRRNSSVKIYAAEPVEQLCGALRKTFDNRLEVIQKAFSSSKGKKRFSVANALTHCSSFIESPGIQEPVGGGGIEHLEIDVSTIDDFVSEENITKLDLIKMDIEGAELDALEGAKDTMKNLRPEILACTYHLPSHYEEITAFLTQQGYEVRVSKGVISTEGDYGERPHFRKGLVFAYPAAG